MEIQQVINDLKDIHENMKTIAENLKVEFKHCNCIKSIYAADSNESSISQMNKTFNEYSLRRHSIADDVKDYLNRTVNISSILFHLTENHYSASLRDRLAFENVRLLIRQWSDDEAYSIIDQIMSIDYEWFTDLFYVLLIEENDFKYSEVNDGGYDYCDSPVYHNYHHDESTELRYGEYL